MPSPKRSKDTHRMPAGTPVGVWLGASRIAGRRIWHAPVAERRANAVGASTIPHIHGEHRIPVVGNETPGGPQPKEGPPTKVVQIPKGMCPACIAGWRRPRTKGGKRWT